MTPTFTRAEARAFKLAIDCIRREMKRIVWDANCARLYVGSPSQQRALKRYEKMVEAIEILEAL